MKNLKINQIVENILQLPKGKTSTIVCRVLELNVAGTDMVRLCDARETRDTAWLIANDRTWAAPLENIRHHDADCIICHKDGLVLLGAL